jgi:hypothetical protein
MFKFVRKLLQPTLTVVRRDLPQLNFERGVLTLSQEIVVQGLTILLFYERFFFLLFDVREIISRVLEIIV